MQYAIQQSQETTSRGKKMPRASTWRADAISVLLGQGTLLGCWSWEISPGECGSGDWNFESEPNSALLAPPFFSYAATIFPISLFSKTIKGRAESFLQNRESPERFASLLPAFAGKDEVPYFFSGEGV